MNASYCSLAWVGITTDPDGTLRPCCVSRDHVLKDDGTPYNLGVDKLDDIYNSNFYKKLRRDMLDGVTISGCETCYNNEKYGRESRRLINNQTFQDKVFANTTTDCKIEYLDLRLGNQCNLKCRMCHPANSSMIQAELNENAILKEFYTKIKDIPEWYNTEVFDDNINPNLPNLITFYMTGGEPTLIKKNYDIMQRLIERGQSEKLTVIINTNMTNTNPKFYSLIKQFRKVIIQMSIDAVDDLAYYIRYPTDFNIVDRTINDLLAIGDNIVLKATPCIQISNLNKLTELFEYLENFNRKAKKQVIDISPTFVVTPKYLDIAYLPTTYKINSYKKIHLWMLENCKYQNKEFKNTMTALRKKCAEEMFDKLQLQQFIKYNSTLDTIRNCKLENYNKELYEVLKDYV